MEMYQKGMEYYFDRDLTKKERSEELKANLAQGNYNSAKSQSEELEIKINREVIYGFALPIWASNNSNLIPCHPVDVVGERREEGKDPADT